MLYDIHVDWQGHLQSSSWPLVDRCCIEHHSCSEGIPHSVANQGDILAQTGPTSTDPENDDDETDQHKQDTVDVTSDITEAKYLFDKAMLSTFSMENVCSAGVLVRIKGNWMT